MYIIQIDLEQAKNIYEDDGDNDTRELLFMALYEERQNENFEDEQMMKYTLKGKLLVP